MNRKARKILGGMSISGLILVGSLPLMAQYDRPTCTTRAKSKKDELSKDKAKDNAAAKKKSEKSAPAKSSK